MRVFAVLIMFAAQLAYAGDFQLWVTYDLPSHEEIELNLLEATDSEIAVWAATFSWPRLEDVHDDLDLAFYNNYQEVARHVSLQKMRQLNYQALLRALRSESEISSTAQVALAWYRIGREFPHWEEQAVRLGPNIYFKARTRYLNSHRP